MAEFDFLGPVTLYRPNGNFQLSTTAIFDATDGNPADNQFDTSEALTYQLVGPGLTGGAASYLGTIEVGGVDYPVFTGATGVSLVIGIELDSATYPTLSDLPPLDSTNFTVALCFAEGTHIATPSGEVPVETLRIGDSVENADGAVLPVKWVGRQLMRKWFSGAHNQLVRFRAGALGNGVPHSDLTVTADHGMVIDGYVINASALVNGAMIDFVPINELPDSFTVYHIETEAHDVILANGAQSESYLDLPGRAAFDNYQEYVDLYGTEHTITENPMPRIPSARLIPQGLQTRIQNCA